MKRRGAGLLAGLAVVGIAAAGCGVEPGARAGDCFESGTAAAFAWDSEVGCGDEHTVEVFEAVRVTGELGTYPRAALTRQGSPARELYLGLVTDLCEPAWAAYTGYARLAPNAPDGAVLPALYGDMAVEAVPANRWDAGDKKVVCYQVYGQPGADGERAVTVESLVLDDLRSRPDSVPLAARDCALSPTRQRGERKVPCDQPHDREYLGNLDAAAFTATTPGLDQAFLQRFDSRTAPDAQWAVLDGLCSRVVGSLTTTQRPDIRVLAQVFSADPQWGWGDEGSYRTACFAQTTELTERSVVGIGDAPLQAE